MNTIWTLVFYSFLLSTLGRHAQTHSATQKVIVIDPGHGGIDSGASSKNGVAEKDIVLGLAYAIDYWNKKLYDTEMDIYFSRSTDSLISLSDRTYLAKTIKPDIFISLHCNHAANKGAKGVEAYVYESELSDSTFKEESIALASSLIAALKVHLGFASRGIKSANFQVLRETQSVCPSVLLELGFLSNEKEASYLNDSSKITALSLSILETLYKF